MTVPGSKSGTNRSLLLAALAEGKSVVAGALRSDDCDRLVVALQTLGVRCLEVEHGWEVHGIGGRFPAGGTVDLGDGGTPARFMLAAATLCAEPVTIDGSARVRERPMGDGVRILESLGARVEWLGEEGIFRCVASAGSLGERSRSVKWHPANFSLPRCWWRLGRHMGSRCGAPKLQQARRTFG